MDQYTIIQVSRSEFEEIIKSIIKDYLSVPSENHIDQTSDDFYMDSSEVARYLNISKVTLWKWRKANKIPYIKIGRSIRYRKSEIDKALKNGDIGRNSR